MYAHIVCGAARRDPVHEKWSINQERQEYHPHAQIPDVDRLPGCGSGQEGVGVAERCDVRIRSGEPRRCASEWVGG